MIPNIFLNVFQKDRDWVTATFKFLCGFARDGHSSSIPLFLLILLRFLRSTFWSFNPPTFGLCTKPFRMIWNLKKPTLNDNVYKNKRFILHTFSHYHIRFKSCDRIKQSDQKIVHSWELFEHLRTKWRRSMKKTH